MISKLEDKKDSNLIDEESNQTFKLIEKYKEKFKDSESEIKCIELLDKVSLMTPENIHINAFMYEPILDLGEKHLIKLFNNLEKELIKIKENGGKLAYG